MTQEKRKTRIFNLAVVIERALGMDKNLDVDNNIEKSLNLYGARHINAYVIQALLYIENQQKTIDAQHEAIDALEKRIKHLEEDLRILPLEYKKRLPASSSLPPKL